MARSSRHKVIRLKLEQPLPREVFARYGEVRELLSEDTAWEVALEVPRSGPKRWPRTFWAGFLFRTS